MAQDDGDKEEPPGDFGWRPDDFDEGLSERHAGEGSSVASMVAARGRMKIELKGNRERERGAVW